MQFLLEGQEEIGSPNLPAFLKKHKRLLKADFALSADGGQESSEQAILALGLRGASAFEVIIKTLDRDVHSGEPIFVCCHTSPYLQWKANSTNLLSRLLLIEALGDCRSARLLA